MEKLNAHGPYNHAVWRRGDLQISQEDQLAGRSERLASEIRSYLMDRFTLAELEQFSIVDIGCYDGWLLHQLSDLPFQRMVGIEPRQKNIDKGRVARQALQLECRVDFVQGDLESLSEEFDIVLCIGLLHHLPSLAEAMRQVTTFCRRALIIDCLCLSESHLTANLRKELELKDVVYRFHQPVLGISGYKLESAYYDGSTKQTGIVSIPTLSALAMFLEYHGFGTPNLLIDPETYRREIFCSGGRNSQAVCLASQRTVGDGLPEDDWINSYESNMLATLVDQATITWLTQRYAAEVMPGELVDTVRSSATWLARWTAIYLRLPFSASGWWKPILGWLLPDGVSREIILNLKYSPRDKLTVELAKHWCRQGQHQQAFDLLRTLTTTLNADWRSIYRAFFLLAWCGQQLGDQEKFSHYRELCLTANPQFPFDSLLTRLQRDWQ